MNDATNTDSKLSRVILHVDMDAFYASVEERENPELVGKPLIVGGFSEGRGVVAAANYIVRKFGVHSAMPTSTALRLCPDAIVIRPRMDLYAKISHQIREAFLRFTPLVEPLSLDEAFLDVTGSDKLFGTGLQIARRLKEEIRQETSLVASVGVAPNKFLAKIASDLKKPDGLVVVGPANIGPFLAGLPVSRLWGVGQVTGRVFDRLGVSTIGEIRQLEPDVLTQHFGQQGQHFWQLAHGIDDRPVIPDREAKSISNETTFATDISDVHVLRSWMLDLSENVAHRLRHQKLHARTVHIKVRFADFQTFTRSKTLSRSTNVTKEIWNAASELLDQTLPLKNDGVRLLGVGLSRFGAPEVVQKSLFGDEINEKEQQLDAVADEIREKFGNSLLSRGSSLQKPTDRHPPVQ